MRDGSRLIGLLDEVVTGVGLVMHELCVGVLVEEEKENLDVTK